MRLFDRLRPSARAIRGVGGPGDIGLLRRAGHRSRDGPDRAHPHPAPGHAGEASAAAGTQGQPQRSRDAAPHPGFVRPPRDAGGHTSGAGGHMHSRVRSGEREGEREREEWREGPEVKGLEHLRDLLSVVPKM